LRIAIQNQHARDVSLPNRPVETDCAARRICKIAIWSVWTPLQPLFHAFLRAAA
jgi:hypothetical protein